MKNTFVALGMVAGVVAIVVAGYAIKYYTADVRGRIDANEEIKSGASRIANYDHFFNLCASIQTNEATIDALLAELKDAVDNDDKGRIQSTLTGVRSARFGAINQYNADASKGYTQGQFRDSQLPYQIAASAYPDGGKTTCA